MNQKLRDDKDAIEAAHQAVSYLKQIKFSENLDIPVAFARRYSYASTIFHELRSRNHTILDALDDTFPHSCISLFPTLHTGETSTLSFAELICYSSF